MSSLYSYPNLLPLPAWRCGRTLAAVQPYRFDQLLGWWGGQGRGWRRRMRRWRSAERYADHRTGLMERFAKRAIPPPRDHTMKLLIASANAEYQIITSLSRTARSEASWASLSKGSDRSTGAARRGVHAHHHGTAGSIGLGEGFYRRQPRCHRCRCLASCTMVVRPGRTFEIVVTAPISAGFLESSYRTALYS